MHSVTLEQIQKALPRFPSDVIETWLLPYAREDGWPPPPNRWHAMLLERPLDYWRLLEWHPEDLELQPQAFDASSIEAISGLIETNVHGVVNAYSSLRDTQNRFNNLLEYITTNHDLPHPPVLLREGSNLQTADGTHRIAALLWLQEQAGATWPVRCWIASMP